MIYVIPGMFIEKKNLLSYSKTKWKYLKITE